VHQAELDEWSRRDGPLHRRDARAKLLVLLAYLVALATVNTVTPLAAAGFAALLGLAVALSRLPAGGLAWRAAAVAPFVVVFTVASWVAGEPARAMALLLRSYLSAVAVLIVVGTTPLPLLLKGIEHLGGPRFLITVVQILYRYLFVLSEQAQHMRLAAASRGAAGKGWQANRARFKAAAGAVAVLFARSYARAQTIHRAMLARGYQGVLPSLRANRWQAADWAFLTVGLLLCVSLRLALEYAG